MEYSNIFDIYVIIEISPFQFLNVVSNEEGNMKFIVIILGLILSSFDCCGLSQVQTEKNENKQFFYAINIAEDDISQQDVSKYIPLEAKENIFENNSRMFLIFEKTSENVSMEIDKLLDKYQRSGYSETSINRFRFLKQKANYESFYRVKTPAISDSDHVKRDTNNQIIYIKYLTQQRF